MILRTYVFKRGTIEDVKFENGMAKVEDKDIIKKLLDTGIVFAEEVKQEPVKTIKVDTTIAIKKEIYKK